ncbi:sigma-70 family RNA polymerase sigma factor [Aeoliella mucimassa]|uniref:RNA polymerase sigma factor n=1 Tax=Aeoliella mucimassa TaxID=2527972 RepID=A0A518AQ65_9BACT|nr:sigma-70 family RNA polymerase sigma factor [Aeoliella mucimassa]QDU56863.1 RNA polymerase sigma factor [Aeoliella mucimassa]
MESNEDKTATFVRLLRANDRRLSTYVHASVPSWADAEDILQETSVRLWEQFDRFELGTNFGAWACTIARYVIMSHREKKSRDKLHFSQEVLDLIDEQIDKSLAEYDVRLEALPKCIDELSEGNRQLLALCYDSDMKIKEVADLLNRTANATYLAVSRVRQWLYSCIERRVGGQQSG